MFDFINREPKNKLEFIAQNALVLGMLLGLIVLGSFVGGAS